MIIVLFIIAAFGIFIASRSIWVESSGWSDVQNKYGEHDKIHITHFVMLIVFIIILFSLAFFTREPNAMDVYRNKTMLERTFVDSVCVDSIVIFK